MRLATALGHGVEKGMRLWHVPAGYRRIRGPQVAACKVEAVMADEARFAKVYLLALF